MTIETIEHGSYVLVGSEVFDFTGLDRLNHLKQRLGPDSIQMGLAVDPATRRIIRTDFGIYARPELLQQVQSEGLIPSYNPQGRPFTYEDSVRVALEEQLALPGPC